MPVKQLADLDWCPLQAAIGQNVPKSFRFIWPLSNQACKHHAGHLVGAGPGVLSRKAKHSLQLVHWGLYFSVCVCTLPPSSLPEVSASYAVRHQLTFQGGLLDLSNVFTRTGQGELDLHVRGFHWDPAPPEGQMGMQPGLTGRTQSASLRPAVCWSLASPPGLRGGAEGNSGTFNPRLGRIFKILLDLLQLYDYCFRCKYTHMHPTQALIKVLSEKAPFHPPHSIHRPGSYPSFHRHPMYLVFCVSL